MSEAVSISVDIGPLIAQCKNAAVFTNQDTQTLIKQQATLLVFNGQNTGIVNLTPPFSKGVKGAKAYEQAQIAIRRDIFGGRRRAGIFNALPDTMIDQALETGIYSSGNVRLFTKKNGDVYGTERTLFKPEASQEDLRDHHKKFFKNGRMTSAGSRTRDIGRWKFIDKLTIRRSTADEYLKTLYKKIGFAAACFYVAAKKIGLKPRGVPKWIRDHESAPGVGYDPGFTPDSTKFAITLVSTLNYNGGLDMSSKVRYALKYRENAMKRRLPYLIRAALKKANFQ